MNNEIVQSILSTFTAVQTYLQALNSCTVVWFFAILCDSLNVWLYYVTWLTGYFSSSAAAVLVRHPGRSPPPSVVICHPQQPWAQARKPLGWSVCPLNALSSLSGADTWSLENLHHQPACWQSFSVLARAKRDGRLSPLSTRASQPYTACKLTAPP